MRLFKGSKASIGAISVALIAGGLFGSIFTQLYFEKNVRTEQQLRLKRDLVAEQYPDLQKMKRFAELGLRKRLHIFREQVMFGVDLIEDDTTFFLNTDSTGYEIKFGPFPFSRDPELSIPKHFIVKSSIIPLGEILMSSIPNDSLLKAEWMMLADEIKNARDRMDFNAYIQFQKIVTYVQKYPWPSDELASSYSKLKKSHWASDSAIKKWDSLNTNLFNTIEKILQLR